ncbi:MFS transporter [Leifsonia kafniensis]|uniref:MFS transporter n=1 Tax=Leifsonia kafniensis TaxID=475957 RepID=A0ABP7K031_9MICO
MTRTLLEASPAHDSSTGGIRRLVALATIGIFVTYLPINAVGGALSTIAVATGATPTDLQWTTGAYVILMAISVLPAGLYGERYGRRLIYTLGLAFTVLGSATAFVASLFANGSIPLLWIGQGVAGIGAGLLIPTTLALIAVAEPDPRRRGRHIAMWATGTVAGLAVGPVLSGVILEFAGWGWIFLPVTVLAAATMIVARFMLPETPSFPERGLDWPGQISVSLAIALIVFGVIEGGASGWLSLPALIGLGGGAVSLIVFISVELRTQTPVVPLGMFRLRGFSAATLSAVVTLFSIVGTMFVLSIFLGQDQGLNALEIGMRVVFVPGVAALFNPIVGRLMRHVQPLHLLCAGLATAIAGMVAISGVTTTTTFADLAWRLALFGLSNALMLTSLTVVAVNSVPGHQAGAAAATSAALRQLGGALGPAILGTVYFSVMQAGGTAESGLSAAALTTAAVLAVALAACLAVAAQSLSSSRAEGAVPRSARPNLLSGVR